MIKFLALMCLSMALFCGGCMNHAGITTTPASPSVSADQQVYADLLTAQDTLEKLKAQPIVAKNLKDQLNKALASYNLAQNVFVNYEKNKLSNASNPDDFAKMQAAVNSFKTQLAATESAFQKKE